MSKERKPAYLNRCLWIIAKTLRSGYAHDSLFSCLSDDERYRPGYERAVNQVVVAKLGEESSTYPTSQVRIWKIFDRATYNKLLQLYPQIMKRGNVQLDRVVVVQLLMESSYYGKMKDGTDVLVYKLPVPGRYVVSFDWRDAKSPISKLTGESVDIWISDDLAPVYCFLSREEVERDMVVDDVKVSNKQPSKPLTRLGDTLHRTFQRIIKLRGDSYPEED